MRTVKLPDGTEIPALGQVPGTWASGPAPPKDEVAALKLGIELGRDVDRHSRDGTAMVRLKRSSPKRPLARRDGLFIVSKVLPHNASRTGVLAACERSLKRLRTDRIDLYLLHWRGSHPLADTVAAFETAAGSRKNPLLGCIQFRHRRHAGVLCRATAPARTAPRTRFCIMSGAVASNTICCPGRPNTKSH